MQIKKSIIFLAFSCILIVNVFAQKKPMPKIFNYVRSEMTYKYALGFGDEQLQALDFYIGCKFKNTLSVGLCTGNTIKLNFDTDKFSWYVPTGIGVRYRLFEKSNSKRDYDFEPYVNFTHGGSFTSEEPGNDYLSYDVGVNFVAKECSYLLLGMGVGQLFFSNEEKDLLNIYITFGFKL